MEVSLGKYLKGLREECNEGLEDMAEKLNIDYLDLERIEDNEKTAPLNLGEKIVDIYNLDVEELDSLNRLIEENIVAVNERTEGKGFFKSLFGFSNKNEEKEVKNKKVKVKKVDSRGEEDLVSKVKTREEEILSFDFNSSKEFLDKLIEEQLEEINEEEILKSKIKGLIKDLKDKEVQVKTIEEHFLKDLQSTDREKEIEEVLSNIDSTIFKVRLSEDSLLVEYYTEEDPTSMKFINTIYSLLVDKFPDYEDIAKINYNKNLLEEKLKLEEMLSYKAGLEEDIKNLKLDLDKKKLEVTAEINKIKQDIEEYRLEKLKEFTLKEEERKVLLAKKKQEEEEKAKEAVREKLRLELELAKNKKLEEEKKLKEELERSRIKEDIKLDQEDTKLNKEEDLEDRVSLEEVIGKYNLNKEEVDRTIDKLGLRHLVVGSYVTKSLANFILFDLGIDTNKLDDSSKETIQNNKKDNKHSFEEENLKENNKKGKNYKTDVETKDENKINDIDSISSKSYSPTIDEEATNLKLKEGLDKKLEDKTRGKEVDKTKRKEVKIKEPKISKDKKNKKEVSNKTNKGKNSSSKDSSKGSKKNNKNNNKNNSKEDKIKEETSIGAKTDLMDEFTSKKYQDEPTVFDKLKDLYTKHKPWSIVVSFVVLFLVLAGLFNLVSNKFSVKQKLITSYAKTYDKIDNISERISISFDTKGSIEELDKLSLNVDKTSNYKTNEVYRNLELDAGDEEFIWERYGRNDYMVMKSAFDPQYIKVENIKDFQFKPMSLGNSLAKIATLDINSSNTRMKLVKNVLGDTKEKNYEYTKTIGKEEANQLYNSIFKEFLKINQELTKQELEVERKLEHKDFIIEDVEELFNNIYNDIEVEKASYIANVNKEGKLVSYGYTFDILVNGKDKGQMFIDNTIFNINDKKLQLEKEEYSMNSIDLKILTPRIEKEIEVLDKNNIEVEDIREQTGTLEDLENLDGVEWDNMNPTQTITNNKEVKEEKIIPQEVLRERQKEKEEKQKELEGITGTVNTNSSEAGIVAD